MMITCPAIKLLSFCYQSQFGIVSHLKLQNYKIINLQQPKISHSHTLHLLRMASESLPHPSLGDDNDSGDSSSSLFIPVSLNVQDALQVINESKEFNSDILQYVNALTPLTVGNNYHIISVFGSQLTGKLTLLNTLFYTNFDVMDERNRLQTTKGIWMAFSPHILCTQDSTKQKQHPENIFVMDVEGTDGRERGEDQDFERKAALFALSTTEVLIINTWETQIGLYQGANMGLLKTVFEVNLLLFGRSKLDATAGDSGHKVLLLFVIRDHVGVTPKELLAETLRQDMDTLWSNLNKPADLEDLKFSDFFDVSFHTLAHKVLQNDKFLQDVQLLGDRFVDSKNPEYIFNKNYHHNIPIDGWTMYAEQCWDQIDNNKDLDLPTQQILVAKFKCDEILNAVFSEFLEKFEKANILINKQPADYEEIGLYFQDLSKEILDDFDSLALRYNKSVYDNKRSLLESKINAKFKEIYDISTKKIFEQILKRFKDNFKTKNSTSVSFIDRVITKKEAALKEFETTIKLLDPTTKFPAPYQELSDDLDKVVAAQQVNELNNFIKKSNKKISSYMSKTITALISDPQDDIWDTIISKFHSKINELLSDYKTDSSYDFKLGTSAVQNSATVRVFKFQSWVKLEELVKSFLSKESILVLLKDRFDDRFRYDENGLPRMYQNVLELENNFKIAKEYALKIIPYVTYARTKEGEAIKPDFDIYSKSNRKVYSLVSLLVNDITGGLPEEADAENEVSDSDTDDDESDDENEEAFAQIISEKDKAQVLSKFKRETDAMFVETNRLLIQHATLIPYWIYLVILVLGWNEFMAVIRNPLTFLLLLILGTGIYVMYTLNLLKPALVVAQKMVDESIVIAKSKAKEWILDEHELHGRNLGKLAGKKEEEEVDEIELDDLSEVKHE